MIRPLEVYHEESKRARFSLMFDSSPNDIQAPDSFSSLQMLNLNECCHFLNAQLEDNVIINDVQASNKEEKCKACLNFTCDALSQFVDNNCKLSGEDRANSNLDVECKKLESNNQDMSFHRNNNNNVCKQQCNGDVCSESIYCSSPSHKNRFYHFKSITKDSVDTSDDTFKPIERKCSSNEKYFRCSQHRNEIYSKKAAKSCMNGPMGIYPSPHQYPKTSNSTETKDLNNTASSNSLQIPPCSFGSCNDDESVLENNVNHCNSLKDRDPHVISSPSFHNKENSQLPSFVSSKRKSSFETQDISSSLSQQNQPGPPNISSHPNDSSNVDSINLDIADDNSVNVEETEVVFKQVSSNAKSLAQNELDDDKCFKQVKKSSTESLSDAVSDEFDVISDFESDDGDFASDDEDDNMNDSDMSDADGSFSRRSSFTSPSTSTDIFTPALSFGTSSSAALTEGLDSLSIQSSSEVDFMSFGSSLASHSEYNLPAMKTGIATKLPLRPSLFPGIPPTIYFSIEGESVMPFPSEIRHQLRWKLSTITPIIMKKTVTRAGISLTKSTTDWCGTWGKQVKVVNFKAIKSYQKVNHFPWTFQIGRKDKLWKNVWRMRLKHGHPAFHFLPQTYILPHDIKALKRAWENLNQKKPKVRHKWIIKPPASARGQGIKVIHKWSQIPKKWPLIVQKYLSNPYLINGSKFDLRLYVLVTSFDPLRIYVFDDGLVRFASVKYSANVRSLNDKFMHLTNYSINKKSASYTANEDIHACQGHKWSLKSLWKYMQRKGIDTKSLWESIIDIIIKTIISCETSVSNMMKRYVKSQFNCYELFGFDIMLDEKLKPWLLEVNISPSLHSNSPLDASIKGQLAKDLLNLAGFNIPNRISESSKNAILTKFGLSPDRAPLCHDKKLYANMLTEEEKAKIIQFEQIYNSLGTTQLSVLEHLTVDDMKHLMLSEDELMRAGHFIRIYPSSQNHLYHKYFDQLRYYDMLLDAWEVMYSNKRSIGIQRLQKLYKNHLDAEKKVETKITCKSTAKEAKKTTSKKLAKTSKIVKKNRKPTKVKSPKKPAAESTTDSIV